MEEEWKHRFDIKFYIHITFKILKNIYNLKYIKYIKFCEIYEIFIYIYITWIQFPINIEI